MASTPPGTRNTRTAHTQLLHGPSGGKQRSVPTPAGFGALQRSVAGKHAALCATLCQDIWVCSEIGLVLQHIGVGLQTKKDCTENFGCNIHKVSESPRITLGITPSERQKPACPQELTLFLTGCDISHGCFPCYQRTNSPVPFPPSPLACQQATPGTADPVLPPFPTATKQRYCKPTSRRAIPGLTWTGAARHGKRDSSGYMGTCQQSCAVLNLPQTQSAATLRRCTP